MTVQEAMKKLEGKTGRGKWLIRSGGEFSILNSLRDPYWHSEAMYLGSDVQIAAAAEWMAEATA